MKKYTVVFNTFNCLKAVDCYSKEDYKNVLTNIYMFNNVFFDSSFHERLFDNLKVGDRIETKLYIVICSNPNYKDIAVLYAENHGIVEYTVKHNKMIYYINIERSTYKITVDLDTMAELGCIRLKNYYKKGKPTTK